MSAAPVSRRRAVLELLGASLLFGLSAYLAKWATRSVPGEEVALLRFLFGLLFAYAQSALRRAPLRYQRYDMLVLRGLLGASAGLLYFLALAEIPVGTATLLNCTSPVFTALVAVVILREPLPLRRGLAMIATGAGVVLVLVGQGAGLGGPLAWQGVALASGVLAGGAVATIRAVRRYNGPWEVFVFFNGMGVVATAPFALASWVWPDGATWALLIVMSTVMVAAQLLMTHALGHVEASISAALTPLTPVTSFLLGFALDGDPVTALSLAGGALTLAGVTWVARQDAGRKAPVAQTTPHPA